MTMNKRHLKQPDDLPLWIANVRKVKLDEDGFQRIKTMAIKLNRGTNEEVVEHQKTVLIFYGKTSLPVYSFDLRTDTRTISTEYVRAKTKRHVLTAAQRWWPTLKGAKDV